MSEPAWVPLGAAPSGDPGVEVAYGEFTSGITITGTSEAGATPIVTAPAFTADGTSAYFFDFFAARVEAFTQQDPACRFCLFEDGVTVGAFGDLNPNVAAGGESSDVQSLVRMAMRRTPAAGARTYSVRAFHSGANNPIVRGGTGGAGQFLPGFLRITKVPSGVQVPTWSPQPVAVVTSLPASPVDGQEIILVDSLTAPTYSWHLKFIAAKASNRWVFVGGPPLYAMVDASQATSSAGPVDLGTVGPGVTAPVAGQYRLHGGARLSTGSGDGILSYKVGAAAAVALSQATPGGVHTYPNDIVTITALAGDLVKLMYGGAGGSGYTWGDRWIELLPIAVGG